MTLIQRFMFYRLVGYSAVVALAFAVVVLLTTTPELFSLLAQGAVSFGRFLVALAALMPMVFYLVGPLSITAAVAYAYHQWTRHNEILSLRMAGYTEWALALPGIAAGVVAMLFTASMSLYLLPVSFRTFEDISYTAVHSLTISALEEGFLQRVVPNLSISFKKRLNDEEIEGVTVLDGRKADVFKYIFAEHGQFAVRGQPVPEQVLILKTGSYITRSVHEDESKRIYFSELIVPIDVESKIRPWRGFFEEHIDNLVEPPDHIRAVPGEYGQWIAEGHKRILMPILSLSYALFALAVMLRGRNPRLGRVIRSIVLALAIGGWHGLMVATHSFVSRIPVLLPAYYFLVLVPGITGVVMLFLAEHGRYRKVPARRPVEA